MAKSLAVFCDDEGRILEVLRVGDGLRAPRPGDHLESFVDAHSRGDLVPFLAAVRRDGHALGCELYLPIRGRAVAFQVAGAALSGRLLVLANESHDELLRLVEELARINNEQAAELRHALKDLSGRRVALDDASVFAEMSRLNNDLATAQRELIQRSAHLEQLLRDKNELLGMAAHDLRNPLAAILGLAEHLLQDPENTLLASQRDAVEHIRASSDHMLILVEELLDFAAVEAGTITLKRAPTDLVTLARRTVRLGRELGRAKGVEVELEVDPTAPGLAAVDVDGPKVAQALVNLITNAIKFSRPGGAVTVRLGRRDDDVVFEVEDHGVGIAGDLLPGLFTPFRPGRRGTGGEKSSGLGLAIVRRIVHGHGGLVEVRSEVDVGTTLTLTLPIDAHVRVSPESEAELRRRLEVLIADDDPLCGVVVARLVDDVGHHATLVEGVAEAIAAIRERSFDVALLDLEMPGGGGGAIAAAVRERDQGRGDGVRTPVIAVTGHRGVRASSRAEGADFDDVVGKPIDRAELQRILAPLAR